VVEVVGDEHASGIYYVPPGTLVNRFLKSAGIAKRFKNNFELKNGMKLIVHPGSEKMEIVVAEIHNAAKISIGMPIDINRASEEDLVLIKGIGPVTAKKILELRQKSKGIKDMKQLMQIKGIKEKRLGKNRKIFICKKNKKSISGYGQRCLWPFFLHSDLFPSFAASRCCAPGIIFPLHRLLDPSTNLSDYSLFV